MHRSLHHRIPSLTALVAFEAAGRHGSFTLAATGLGVSQAAVSRRIAALEADLGVPLFVRANRSVRLTPAGRVLHDAVASGFDGIAGAVAELRAPRVDLTVSVSVAFGHFRLLPILSSFRAAVPGIGLRVISEDDWHAPHDRTIDVAIRYGRPPFTGMTVMGSLAETLAPVCSPDVALALRGLSVEALVRQDTIALIESDAPEPSWLNWSQWLARGGWTGGPVDAGLTFSSYSDAAYAAMAGQGVALGWTGLLERPLADGRLVTLDLPAVEPEERHHILMPQHRPPTPAASAFVHWLNAGAASG